MSSSLFYYCLSFFCAPCAASVILPGGLGAAGGLAAVPANQTSYQGNKPALEARITTRARLSGTIGTSPICICPGRGLQDPGNAGA